MNEPLPIQETSNPVPGNPSPELVIKPQIQSEEKLPGMVIVAIVLSWLIYIPISLSFLFFSGVMSIAGGVNSILIAATVFMNLIPFLGMVFMTRLAIIKRKIIFAVLSPLVSLVLLQICFSLSVFLVIFFYKTQENKIPKPVILATETIFKCSDFKSVNVTDYAVFLVKLTKSSTSRSNIGKISDDKLDLIVMRHIEKDKEKMEALNDCKNIDQKSISDLYNITFEE